MMSGTRNAPPISISSPRETIDLLAKGERVEHQHHGGGVVVDDRRGLGAGQVAQQRRDMIVALAPPPGRQVEFQRGRAAHRLGRGLGGFRPAAARGRDWCAAPCRSD